MRRMLDSDLAWRFRRSPIAIITETVFQWPGMGLLFIQAVTFADIPVMAAYLCLIALIFVVINLVVDLLYFAVDPRLRVGGGRGH